MKFIKLKNNKIEAFYDDSKNKNIPSDAIEITKIQFGELIKETELYNVEYDGTTLSYHKVDDLSDIDEMRTYYKKAIDEYAGEIRLKYITDIPGQDATYSLKYEEALKYINSDKNTVDETEFNMLYKESITTNKSLANLANEIITLRNIWVDKASSIESIRLGKKASLDMAMDENTIINIYNGAINEFNNI